MHHARQRWMQQKLVQPSVTSRMSKPNRQNDQARAARPFVAVGALHLPPARERPCPPLAGKAQKANRVHQFFYPEPRRRRCSMMKIVVPTAPAHSPLAAMAAQPQAFASGSAYPLGTRPQHRHGSGKERLEFRPVRPASRGFPRTGDKSPAPGG